MNCLITGGSSEIGANLAFKLANLGYDLCLTYNTNKVPCLKLKEELEKKYSIKCLALKCNLKNENEIKNVITTIKKEYKTLDILVNNAKIS